MAYPNLNELLPFVIAFGGSLFIAWFSIPVVVRVASLRHLTDTPGKRKVHKKEIPTLGGVAIYAGFATGFFMSVNGFMEGVTYFTVATLLLFFVGMKDDLITLDPKKKLVAEILAAVILIYFTDIRITDFHGFMGITEIPVWLTYFSTIFLMMVIINAINLYDGIDGLAALIGIVASVTFGTFFFLSGNSGYTIMSAALAGALLAFLRFNLSSGKNKIFMGDTGSLMVGFLLAALTIGFNEVNAGPSTYHNLYSAPAISIAILIVPLFDTLRVFAVRLWHGQHPFTADNRHIHYLMLRAGFSHRRSTFIISTVHIGIIAVAFYADHIGILWLSLLLFTICLMLTGIVYLRIYRDHLLNKTKIGKEDRGVIGAFVCIKRAVHKRAGVSVKRRAVRPESEKLI